MAKFNPPYSYRSWDYDDWGTIRDADGHPMLKINCHFSGDLNQHRLNETDPCEELGLKVVELLNGSVSETPKKGGE
jgi:hypothetical protein